MKPKIAKTMMTLLVAAAVGGPAAMHAQVSASPERFSPLAAGWLERAQEMRDAANYAGVIDQIGHLYTQQITLAPADAELAAWLLAEASYQRGDDSSLQMLTDFVAQWPASSYADEARMDIGNFHFFRHQWPDALEAYNLVQPAHLNADQKPLLAYRRALSMIKTGHFREARPLVSSLRGKKGYEDACNFYTAYLDYIDGSFTKAYDRFARVPAGTPGMEAPFYMAQIEYSRGDYSQVIDRGTLLLRRGLDPQLRPELCRIVGLSYFKTDQPMQARGYLQEYLNTTPASPSAEAVYALGAIEYSEGEYDAAFDHFSSLTDFSDEIGQGAWLYLGQCYLRQDNPTSAAIAFEKATRLDFDHKVSETALYNYVTAVTRGGKVPFSSSSQMLQHFVDLYPDSPYAAEVDSYLATAYYNDHEYAKALKCIDNIRKPSRSVQGVRQKVLYALGVETMTNGNASQAVTYLQQAAEERDLDRQIAAQSSLWLGDALYSLRRYAEAQKAYEAFLRDDTSRTNRPLAYYNLAYAKYKQKNYAGAASDFAQASKGGDSLPARLQQDARLMRADCLYYIGKYAESKALFSEIVAAQADGADYALYRRALLHGVTGDSKSKLADLTALERLYPDSRWLSKAMLELAHLYEEQGRNDLAADAYKKRLNTTAEVDVDELLRMAEAMHSARRSADLLSVTERIRRAGGLEADELADLSLYEADALADLGRTSEARTIYSGLAKNPTSLAGSKAAVALAESLLASRDYAGARDLMESFTDTGTPHSYWLARGFIALADAYHGLGETSMAREYLMSLRDNYPGSEADIDSMISSRLKKWK